MRWIIEFDGVIGDIAPLSYRAHVGAADAVGWSRLDQPTYRRLTRTKGDEADVLPGAKAVKISQYEAQFLEFFESDEYIQTYKLLEDAAETLRACSKHGTIDIVTLGSNIEARRRWLRSAKPPAWSGRCEALDRDPRRRPAELRTLAENDPRTVVAASSDVLIRSADTADLFTVGVATGSCTPARLHRAGARVVFKSLEEWAKSLDHGMSALIDAGLLPESLSHNAP